MHKVQASVRHISIRGAFISQFAALNSDSHIVKDFFTVLTLHTHIIEVYRANEAKLLFQFLKSQQIEILVVEFPLVSAAWQQFIAIDHVNVSLDLFHLSAPECLPHCNTANPWIHLLDGEHVL